MSHLGKNKRKAQHARVLRGLARPGTGEDRMKVERARREALPKNKALAAAAKARKGR